MQCGALRALTAQRLPGQCRTFAAAADDLYDVAIVGAGLTGAALAAGLGVFT